MIVYCVIESVIYEGDFLLHIASTKVLAQAYVDKSKHPERLVIEKWEVDGGKL